MWHQSLDILLVEDNRIDVELVREALAGWSTPVRLMVAEDGEQAISILRRYEPYSSARTPHLILLDLNLPKKDGIEVLREIKGDARLGEIPVIILTTSGRDKDVRTAYGLHANCYLTKPLDIDSFIAKLKAIEQFWLTHAVLPQH